MVTLLWSLFMVSAGAIPWRQLPIYKDLTTGAVRHDQIPLSQLHRPPRSFLYSVSASLKMASEPFSLHLNCDIEEKEICGKIENAYYRAIEKIKQAIHIKKTIKVQLMVTSFCSDGLSCDGEILGNAIPVSYWTPPKQIPEVDMAYWYPQALMKQLIDVDMNWSEADILVKINMDIPSRVMNANLPSKFWFPEDEQEIHPTQYDIENLLLHEILHGLGIKSGWNSGPMSIPETIFPLNEEKEVNDKLVIASIRPPLIFEKFIKIKATGESFSDYYFKLRNASLAIAAKHSEIVDFWNHVNQSTEIKSLAYQAYSLATTKNSLIFVMDAPNEETYDKFRRANSPIQREPLMMTLSTNDGSFNPGSSLSHLDQTMYADTESFLMCPEALLGHTVLQLTPRNGFPISPQLIRMLNVLGYPINEHPKKLVGQGLPVHERVVHFVNAHIIWIIGLLFLMIMIVLLVKWILHARRKPNPFTSK